MADLTVGQVEGCGEADSESAQTTTIHPQCRNIALRVRDRASCKNCLYLIFG